MFRTLSQHGRNALGIVVTRTTRFDPTRMAARQKYYYDMVFKQIVDDMASQYRQAGFVDGLAGVGFSFFGFGGKKPKAPQIPWNEIYEQAKPLALQYAKQYAEQEERSRIQEEEVGVEQQRQIEITKRSEQATSFALPTGVTSIQRGALVMQVAPPTIVKKK